MGVVNGQLANQTTFNNAFMSRTAATTSTVAAVALENTLPASGAFVSNLQRAVNKVYEGLGTTGETDANINVYANENFIANGDNRKVAIEKLDAQLQTTQNEVDQAELDIDAVEARLDVIEGQPSTFGGDKTFSDDVVIQGNLTVQGTTTAIDSDNLEVEDQNILVNKGGNDASSEGAGITVERTGVDGSLAYEDALASKWKAGALGSESEIITSAPAQTLSGNKTFTGHLIAQGLLRGANEENAVSTGANATIAPTKLVHIVTNASLTSIREITGSANQLLILVNRTGSPISIVDDTAGAFTNGILTGTGANLTLENNAAVWLSRAEYAGPTNRWHVVGGSGGGSVTFDSIAPTTTKGDLIIHNGTNNVRKAVGTNGHRLTARSSDAEGAAWEAPETWTYSSAVSTAKTPPSSGVLLQMSGNSIVVPEGQEWHITGQIEATRPGAGPGYSRVLSYWTGANGDDVSTSTPAGVSGIIAGTFIGDVQFDPVIGDTFMNAPTIRLLGGVGGTTVFLVPLVVVQMPANARIYTYIYGMRVK